MMTRREEGRLMLASTLRLMLVVGLVALAVATFVHQMEMV